MRLAVAACTIALLVLPTACGGSSESDYCAALSAKQTIFADDGSGHDLVTNLSTLEGLGKKAPDDLTDEWQVFLDALKTLDAALKTAGIKPADVVGGKQPAGVSDADWAAIRAAANGLGTPSVADALNGIDQQAKDVCKLQLGL